MDGHLTREEFDRAMHLAMNACKEISELQKDALRRRYVINKDSVDEEPAPPGVSE